MIKNLEDGGTLPELQEGDEAEARRLEYRISKNMGLAYHKLIEMEARGLHRCLPKPDNTGMYTNFASYIFETFGIPEQTYIEKKRAFRTHYLLCEHGMSMKHAKKISQRACTNINQFRKHVGEGKEGKTAIAKLVGDIKSGTVGTSIKEIKEYVREATNGELFEKKPSSKSKKKTGNTTEDLAGLVLEEANTLFVNKFGEEAHEKIQEAMLYTAIYAIRGANDRYLSTKFQRPKDEVITELQYAIWDYYEDFGQTDDLKKFSEYLLKDHE